MDGPIYHVAIVSIPRPPEVTENSNKIVLYILLKTERFIVLIYVMDFQHYLACSTKTKKGTQI